MACVASTSASAWASALPHAPLRPASATWNTKFPAGLSLDLDLPNASRYAPVPAPQKRPTLRLPALASSELPSRRFDPFADEPPVQSTSQNTPPRGRALTPLVVPAPPAPAPTGRRRAPSFSAGSPRSSASVPILLTPSPPTRVRTPAPAPAPIATPHVPLAPSPFHARHYPTPDARARLLARTLLNRIHAVGRPRSPYSSVYGPRCNGYESECGSRGYVPSRLSECVAC